MEISSARTPTAPRVPGLWSRLWFAAAAISLLSAGGAAAQTAAAPSAKVDAAHAAWRKLSQSEVNCVDKALRARNSQIWQLIQRGVGPTDASVAGVRATCRTQAQARPESSGSSAAAQSAAPARAVQAPATQTPAAQAPAAQASAARASSGRDHWSFNGSTLNMVADGSLRKFFYFRPDADAEAGGAQRGDLFLEGRVSDQRFVGTVYGFAGRCGRIPYRVDGSIRDNNRRLELQGQKPRVDGNCAVVGTVLDALTFRSVEQATAVAAAPAAIKPDVTKPAAAKPAIEQAAAVMAAADRAAVERAATEDAAEFKITPGKAPADRPAAGEATPVKIVIAAASESKVAVNQAVAEKASAGTAVQIARAEAARAQADAERARNEAEKAVADAIATVASAQSTISFIYGLISGPALLGVGAMVFLLVRRRRQALPEPSVS